MVATTDPAKLATCGFYPFTMIQMNEVRAIHATQQLVERRVRFAVRPTTGGDYKVFVAPQDVRAVIAPLGSIGWRTSPDDIHTFSDDANGDQVRKTGVYAADDVVRIMADAPRPEAS